MWMQMFLKGVSFVFDGKNNVMYRLHPAQVSQTRKDLFAKDAHTIAQILAPEFQKISTKHNNIMFKYALRMAQYRCISTVKTMQVYAKETCPFSLTQKLRLRIRLLYGNMRGVFKWVYYRFFLRLKV